MNIPRINRGGRQLRATSPGKRASRISPPINSLPFEILAMIFLVVRDTARSQLDWVCLAWVCSYWRQVAIGTALLWASLRITRPCSVDLISVLLARSSGLDLELEVHTAAFEPLDILARVLEHSDRLRSLSLIYLHEQTSAVQSALNVVMPRLHSLSLRVVYHPACLLSNIREFSTLNLEARCVPALRDLHIISVHLLVPASVLRGLVSLELSEFSQISSRLPYEYIYGMLETCGETLQRLHIHNVPCAVMHMSPEPELRFIQLRELKVKASRDMTTANFLHHVRLPHTTRLFVQKEFGASTKEWPRDTSIISENMFPYTRSVRKEALPILLETRKFRLQMGRNLILTGFGADGKDCIWRATADLRQVSRDVTCTMFGPMVGDISQLVKRDLVEEYECHLPPYMPTYDHLPSIVCAFPKLLKFTFGPTRCIQELFEDFLVSRAGIPGLEEITFCMPDVADSLIEMLMKCKKLRLQRGDSVLPPVLWFRLPRRLKSCMTTRKKIAQLRIKLHRIVKLEVQYLDCAFCQRPPQEPHIITPPSPQVKRTYGTRLSTSSNGG
ncbi:hypothetical protein BD414DRAFT_579099 [Trametes punicea]|nr:hypothetical protein BD414DRAFT_579099 [Trametes punicea]